MLNKNKDTCTKKFDKLVQLMLRFRGSTPCDVRCFIKKYERAE